MVQENQPARIPDSGFTISEFRRYETENPDIQSVELFLNGGRSTIRVTRPTVPVDRYYSLITSAFIDTYDINWIKFPFGIFLRAEKGINSGAVNARPREVYYIPQRDGSMLIDNPSHDDDNLPAEIITTLRRGLYMVELSRALPKEDRGKISTVRIDIDLPLQFMGSEYEAGDKSYQRAVSKFQLSSHSGRPLALLNKYRPQERLDLLRSLIQREYPEIDH